MSIDELTDIRGPLSLEVTDPGGAVTSYSFRNPVKFLRAEITTAMARMHAEAAIREGKSVVIKNWLEVAVFEAQGGVVTFPCGPLDEFWSRAGRA